MWFSNRFGDIEGEDDITVDTLDVYQSTKHAYELPVGLPRLTLNYIK